MSDHIVKREDWEIVQQSLGMGRLVFERVYARDVEPTVRRYSMGSTYPCPQCGSNECYGVEHPLQSFHIWCSLCGLMWNSEFARCLACGQMLEVKPATFFPEEHKQFQITCPWCGQEWDLDTIRSAYEMGDEEGMVDRSTPKGANKKPLPDVKLDHVRDVPDREEESFHHLIPESDMTGEVEF